MAGLSTQMLDATDMKHKTSCSMNDIRSIIEVGLKEPAVLTKVCGTSPHYRRPERTERIAIRRMMSTYWDNSSAFALDLVGAIIRQSSFVEKMHNIDWIHSPAVTSTMSRLIAKYGRYFYILSKYEKKIAVPTLDVDLAWRMYHKLCWSPPLLIEAQIPINSVRDHTITIPWPRRLGLSTMMTRSKRTSFQRPSNGLAKHIRGYSIRYTASALVGTAKQSGNHILLPSPGSSRKAITPWTANSIACTTLRPNCATRIRRHISPPTALSKTAPIQ